MRLVNAAFLVIIAFLVIQSQSLAAGSNDPLWYQYINAGKVSFQRKDVANSKRYYTGALLELEKFSGQKNRPALSSNQKQTLGEFQYLIEQPFSNDVFDHGQLSMQQSLKNASYKPDFTRIGDPAYKAEVQAQLKEMKRKQKEYLDKIDSDFREDLNRNGRLLVVYESLLGKNARETKSLSDSIKKQTADYKDQKERFSSTSAILSE